MSDNHSMDRPTLRRFLDEDVEFCGCGNPDDAVGALLQVLRLFPLYNSQAKLAALLPDAGMRYLFLYMLDRTGVMEHGSVIDGSWLTEKGEAVLEALAREQADGFEALLGQHCVHGYDVDDDSHDCMSADHS